MKIASVLTTAAILALASPSLAQTVRLEGTGERRKQMDAMQLQPFASNLWGELSEWSGTPITAESTQGKVVVIVTWSGWYRATHAAVRKAEALHKQHADKGLVVVGVHNPREFAGAAAAAQSLGVTFPYAADAKGDFRNALKIDQDPDFYIIDRAGQLRYADVETDSVEVAVKALLAETAEAAGSILSDRAAREAAAERERMRIRDVSGRVKPGEAPTVQFEVPEPDVYKTKKWPQLGKSRGQFTEFDQLVDKINKGEGVINFPEEGWVSPRPDTKGKITIVYLIDPRWRQMIDIISTMNRVQDIYERDAVVVAGILRPQDLGQNGDEATARAEFEARVQRVVDSIKVNRQMNHALTTGPMTSDLWPNGVIPAFGTVSDLAVTFLITSDGVVRWTDHPNGDLFHSTMSRLISLDPGVQARRKAEDAAAKSK